MAETFPVPVGEDSSYGGNLPGTCRGGIFLCQKPSRYLSGRFLPMAESFPVPVGEDSSYVGKLPGTCREGFFLCRKPSRVSRAENFLWQKPSRVSRAENFQWQKASRVSRVKTSYGRKLPGFPAPESSYGRKLPDNCREGIFLCQKPPRQLSGRFLPMSETFPVTVGEDSPYGKSRKVPAGKDFPMAESFPVTVGKDSSYVGNLPGNCREGFFLCRKPSR
jgi:hypothetical protein